MKNHKSLLRPLVIALGLSSASIPVMSYAQPQAPETIPQRDMERLQNMGPQQIKMLQQMLQNMPPEQRQQVQQMIEQRLQNLPPEQKQQVQQQINQLMQTPQQQREAWVRQVVIASGFTELDLQDAIIAFIEAQEKARAPLRNATYTLSTSLLDPKLTDIQLKTTMADYRDSVAKDQERYKADLAALDAKIKYSTKPRLELLLGVLGIVGQETATLGGIGTIFPDSGFGGNLMTTVVGR